jgi:hypothetical protein
MDIEKYIYLQNISGKDGPLIKNGDVCRFNKPMTGWYPKEYWRELTTNVDVLAALKGHRLLHGGMPVAEYDAFMEKLEREEHDRKSCKVKS